MSQLLSTASALNAGHDLWIVPDLESSRWTLKLDWQLNFQILNASRREPARKAEALVGLLAETDWQETEVALPPTAPLMVSPEGRLPAKWLVVVPAATEIASWPQRVADIWSSLGKPSVRVFLPAKLTANQFTSEWEKAAGADDFALVPDQEGERP